MNRKEKNKAWVFIRNTFLTLIAVVLIWLVFHHSMNLYEKNKYQAIGELVEVDGKNMHVYTKGKGENTILLMTGLGTAAPVLDFEPLINELSKTNRVVVVEPFGYGWSDLTERERTVENIVEETRTALQKLNIEGPYILMPHSLSGIYSMYYSNAYPDEVKAIIGIDPTLPQVLEYFNEPAPTMPGLMGWLAPTGVSRLVMLTIPNKFLPIAEVGTYSDENLAITKAISIWKGYNQNIVKETNEISHNVNKTASMSFPSDLPVMIFTTQAAKATLEGKSMEAFYQSQLIDVENNKLVILEGDHYLHWTQYKVMTVYVNDFIENFSRIDDLQYFSTSTNLRNS